MNYQQFFRPVGTSEMKWGGVFFCKKVDLSSTQGALCTVGPISIFYFTFYLFGGGCVRTQRTPPSYGPDFEEI